MKKSIDDEREEDIEKCTICLCEFEMEEDVRLVFGGYPFMFA